MAGKNEVSGIIGTSDAKGIIQSVSQGIRQLLLLEEKLTLLSREDDRSRKSIEDLQTIVQRMFGTLTEMDKRIAERFAEYDKRLAETDRRVQLQIELAVRNALDKRDGKD
jgi:vacuolar-type H+-ATPase subunit I/STV1